MTWIRENTQYTWAQRCALYMLKKGPLPKHVGIIMDGNRRFARKMSINKSQGHLKGFNKLAETLEWCRDLGITELTVYAFSIENFKRTQEEIDCLMTLAKEKFYKLIEEKETLDKHGVRVSVIGNLDMLPLDVRRLAAEVIISTRQNAKVMLNVCMAYTSRDEMTVAIRNVRDGVQQGILLESDITEEVLERSMYMRDSSSVDLLIRTSGESRFSDFLMWQTSFACLSFVDVLWPEFSIWHLFASVFHYQRNYQAIDESRRLYLANRDLLQATDNTAVANGNGVCTSPSPQVTEEIRRRERVSRYLTDLNDRYWSYLTELYTLPKTCVPLHVPQDC